MQAYNVEVVRGKPRDRSSWGRLAGSISVSIQVCSRGLGDPFDSYLHVGSGNERLEVGGGLAREAVKPERFTGLVKQMSGLVSKGEMDMTRAGGALVVPGSSVKGNLRSRIELSFKPVNGRVRSCFSRTTKPPVKTPKIAWRHWRVWGDTLKEDRGLPCDYIRDGEVCLVCDIFGAPALSSLVFFDDFVGEKVRPEVVDAGYGSRVIAAPPGSVFHGKVWFRNLAEEELGLLLFGMGVSSSPIGRPVLLGKFKYRGAVGNRSMGRVRYIVESISLSPISASLLTLKPGEIARGSKLTETLKLLSDSLNSRLSGELRIVDEVARLG